MKIKLDDGAICPTRAHETDAGLDLYSREEKDIPCIGTQVVHADGQIETLPPCQTFDTGVHMEIPQGFFGKIESRSGLNVKACVVSCGGVIDSDYRGSIVVKLYNFGTKPYRVHKGDRIAQIIIQPCAAPRIEVVDALDDTARGNNGFGSSGR